MSMIVQLPAELNLSVIIGIPLIMIVGVWIVMCVKNNKPKELIVAILVFLMYLSFIGG